MIIGCHVKMAAPDYLAGSVKEALSYQANALMLYTGAPQNTARKPVAQLKVKEARQLMQKAGLPMSRMIIHAPYIINPANSVKESVMELAETFLIQEAQRVHEIGASYLVLHPGSYTTTDLDTGIHACIDHLNAIDDQLPEDVTICLETMAGKGSEIGFAFEQIAEILEHLRSPQRYGVCLDTCHIHDAGYDLTHFDAVLAQFDHTIGRKNLHVIHLNDSKNERGAHKDRHENLGLGKIGFETLHAIAARKDLEDIPKILETPWIDSKAPYGIEIEMLRCGKYDAGRLNALRDPKEAK